MAFKGFTEEDFNVFKLDGLEPRMKALIKQVRPKLEALGNHFSPILTTLTGIEFFPHVAKHARRSVNPPKDTWVAFSHDKRGYKKHPHFEIAMWENRLFVWFAIIDEAANNSEYAHVLKHHIDEIKTIIPERFVWSVDHTKPDVYGEFSPDFLDRLENIKKAELLCGITYSKDEACGHPNILEDIEQVLKELTPLFEWLTKPALKSK